MDDPNKHERFVGVEEVAEFLGLSASHVRRLAEAGRIPAHNYGVGKRCFWKFRLSEIAAQSPDAKGQRTNIAKDRI